MVRRMCPSYGRRVINIVLPQFADSKRVFGSEFDGMELPFSAPPANSAGANKESADSKRVFRTWETSI